MNFGLLVVASTLFHHGAEVVVYDQENQPPTDDLQAFEEVLDRVAPHAVGVGIISVYGYLCALELLQASHERGITTMAGGQSVGAFAAELLANASPCDIVVAGDAEETLPVVLGHILSRTSPPRLPGVAFRGEQPPAPAVCSSLAPASYLEYELYPNWRQFFPLVEESRACPHTCRFCTNERTTLRRWRGKDPDLLIEEVRRAIELWRFDDDAPVVLQCANFGTNPVAAEAFFKGVRQQRLEPRFLAALRVDSGWDRYVALTEGLFDQVHFGLESGSVRQLAAMHKSRAPEAYLESAAAAFSAFSARGVHVGINFVFGYFGESFGTVRETMRFVLSHREVVDSAWGGPFVLYPQTPAWIDLDDARNAYGSELLELSEYCRRLNTYPVHASRFYRHEDAVSSSLLLMRMLNTKSRYYEHYRWYLGPDPANSAGFIGEDVFYREVLGQLNGDRIGVNLDTRDEPKRA